MPVVIMPNGEMVDSVTGNPVNTPVNRVPGMENNLGQLIANDPSQSSVMNPMIREAEKSTPGLMRATNTPTELTVMEKLQMLMDMGLTEGEAIDAIAMEESAGNINPRAFSGRNIDPGRVMREGEMSGMGALGGVPMGGQAPIPMPMPRPQMQDQMGADRTMNPRDRLTPRNAPST